MTDWKSRLRDADPGRDAQMPDADIRRIRRAVLSAASGATSEQTATWPRAFVATAAVFLIVCASALASLQLVTPRIADRTNDAAAIASFERDAAEEDGARPQLHFQTPGGTRIIWVFDPQFEVKGTLP